MTSSMRTHVALVTFKDFRMFTNYKDEFNENSHVALATFEDFRMLTNYKVEFNENSCCFGDIQGL